MMKTMGSGRGRRPREGALGEGRAGRYLLAALGRLLVLAAGVAIGLTLAHVLLGKNRGGRAGRPQATPLAAMAPASGGPAAVRGIEREPPRPDPHAREHGTDRPQSAPRRVWKGPGGLEIAAYGARGGMRVGGPFEVSTAVLSLNPRVVLLRNFASDAMCDALKRAAEYRVKPSLTYVNEVGKKLTVASESRTSKGATVIAQEDRTGHIHGLERKIADTLMVDTNTFEDWQVLSYETGQVRRAPRARAPRGWTDRPRARTTDTPPKTGA